MTNRRGLRIATATGVALGLMFGAAVPALAEDPGAQLVVETPAPEGEASQGPIDQAVPPASEEGGLAARTVGVIPQTGTVGSEVQVSGLNWPATSSVNVTTCGNRGIGGSAACAQNGAQNFQTNEQGSFRGVIRLAEPPKPCPCTVHVTGLTTTDVIDIPVTIADLPTAPVEDLTPDQRIKLDLVVQGSGPIFWSWFGGEAQRTAQVTVENIGTDIIENAEVVITSGRGEDPAQDPQTLQTEQLGPGQIKTLTTDIDIASGTFGKVTVKAALNGVVGTGAARQTTTVYPWGWIVVAWLVLQIPLLGLYKRRPVVLVNDPDAMAESLPLADLAPGATAASALFPTVPGAPAPPEGFVLVGGPQPMPAPPAAPVASAGTVPGMAAAPAQGVDDLRRLLS